mmetsp:Transcript_20835/g.69548  ORF Transcript_20835/g.69548 Transcript_20835/m.69548 type:complete len:88 (+) Transcript_20835:2727-2990(+)
MTSFMNALSADVRTNTSCLQLGRRHRKKQPEERKEKQIKEGREQQEKTKEAKQHKEQEEEVCKQEDEHLITARGRGKGGSGRRVVIL